MNALATLGYENVVDLEGWVPFKKAKVLGACGNMCVDRVAVASGASTNLAMPMRCGKSRFETIDGYCVDTCERHGGRSGPFGTCAMQATQERR